MCTYLKMLFWQYKVAISWVFACMLFESITAYFSPRVIQNILDKGFLAGNYHAVMLWSILLLLFALAGQLSKLAGEWKRTDVQCAFGETLYRSVLRHYMRLPYARIDRSSGAAIVQIQTDVQALLHLFDEASLFAFSRFLLFLGGFIGLFSIEPHMALLVVLFVPIKYLIVRKLSACNESFVDEWIRKTASFAQWFQDISQGIEDVKVYRLEQRVERESSYRQKSIQKLRRNINRNRSIYMMTDQISLHVLTTAVYVVSVYFFSKSTLSIGGIVAFVSYTIYVYSPISALVNFRYELSKILPSYRRLSEFFSIEEEDTEKGAVLSLPRYDKISLTNACFRFSRKPLLQDVSIEIKQGQVIAIKGDNGAGKTTLLRLLLYLYSADRGNLFFNAIPVSKIKPAAYRENFALVNQDTYIFRGTLRENIVLENVFDKRRYMDVLDCMGLRSLEDAEKYISHDSVSAGERRKIGWARAIYADRPIILLDEPFANLDASTKRRFTNEFQHMFRDKAVVIVTHDNERLPCVDYVYTITNYGRVEKEEISHENPE